MLTVLSARYNSHYYIIIPLDQIAFLYVPTATRCHHHPMQGENFVWVEVLAFTAYCPHRSCILD